MGPTMPPETTDPFIMNPEGVARFFARKGRNEGPFPTHYEAFDNPLGYNPMYPDNKLAVINPDRKSTRLNSSHSQISYAVYCLKKKKKKTKQYRDNTQHKT